jgi:hypothetical protein
MRVRAVCVAALTSLVACSAQAASVQEIFEKYGLLGFLAVDCSKEVSRGNDYYVHRLVDADHLQRDIMEARTAVTSVIKIDRAAEVRPNEISVSGSQDGKSYTAVYRVEPSRTRVLEATVDGKVEVAGGRMANGGETPWHNNCAAPQRAQTPPAGATAAVAPAERGPPGSAGSTTVRLDAQPPKTGCTKSAVTISNKSPNATAQRTMNANSECHFWWSDPSTTLALRKAPSYGSVTLEGSNGYVYKPNTDYRGSDNFVIAVQWAAGKTGRTIKGRITYQVTVK